MWSRCSSGSIKIRQFLTPFAMFLIFLWEKRLIIRQLCRLRIMHCPWQQINAFFFTIILSLIKFSFRHFIFHSISRLLSALFKICLGRKLGKRERFVHSHSKSHMWKASDQSSFWRYSSLNHTCFKENLTLQLFLKNNPHFPLCHINICFWNIKSPADFIQIILLLIQVVQSTELLSLGVPWTIIYDIWLTTFF